MRHITSEKIYKLLLKRYPPSYRKEYEVPMLQPFRDLYRDTVKDEGILGVMKLWFLLLIDFIPSVISQHQQEGGETMRSIVAGDVYSKAVKIGFLALLGPMYILAVELFPIFLPGKPEALNLLPVQNNTLIPRFNRKWHPVKHNNTVYQVFCLERRPKKEKG